MFWVHHHDLRHESHHRNRNKVLLNVVGELRIEAFCYRMVDRTHQKRIAIWIRTRSIGSSNCTPRTTLIFNDDRLPKTLAQFCREWPCKGIRATPSWEGIDDPHRFNWPRLSQGQWPKESQRDQSYQFGQFKYKLHFHPLSRLVIG